MIKIVAPALLHAGRRSLADFHRYWAESHGPLFANTREVRRYVQHLTLPEAYDGEPKPSYDGVSMFWYDDIEALRRRDESPASVALRQAVIEDDRQLFDRLPGWPLHHKRASVVAEERVVLDGPTTPSMVKAIFVASRMPGLTLAEFSQHWFEVHGALSAKVPGLRRYVQNHAIAEAYAMPRGMTHDGWAEMWFDDLESLRRAMRTPQWDALRHDEGLFASPMGADIARERVQKDLGWTYRDWGVRAMSEAAIRERLASQGYASLAADASAPAKIKAAAEVEALAVWTEEHLVTIDASRIDARPERR